MNKQIIHKGRVRNFIGRLESFEKLEDKNKKELKEIKNFLVDYFNKEIDLYLFGSYYHGFSDNFSDYDIITSEKLDFQILDKLIYEKLNYKVNMIYHKDKITNILIP